MIVIGNYSLQISVSCGINSRAQLVDHLSEDL